MNKKFDNRPKITLDLINYKETRPNKEPDLETMRRAKRKGNVTERSRRDKASPDEQRVSIIQKKPIEQQDKRKVVKNASPVKSPTVTKPDQN